MGFPCGIIARKSTQSPRPPQRGSCFTYMATVMHVCGVHRWETKALRGLGVPSTYPEESRGAAVSGCWSLAPLSPSQYLALLTSTSLDVLDSTGAEGGCPGMGAQDPQPGLLPEQLCFCPCKILFKYHCHLPNF